jgi:hypothetical protein
MAGYNLHHQHLLRLAAPYIGRPFRPEALVALARIDWEVGQHHVRGLIQFGLIEQVYLRRKKYFGVDPRAASNCDGLDLGVGYFRWTVEETPYCRLTEIGADEAQRLARAYASLRACPRCARPRPVDATYCPRCGTQVG